MNPNDFRTHAHQLVDWMADYLESQADHVVPPTRPGDVLDALPQHAPESPEPFAQIFADFQSLIVPNMTHWNDPRWFAYFPANNSPPSILAEMLVATMGAQCMSWQTSPAATELEQAVMAWLRQACNLPAHFTGVIQDTASTATLVALLSARERATQGQFGQHGTSPKTLRVYATSEAHSSIDKAVKLAGFGLENLVRIPIDAERAMRPDELRRAILEDLKSGNQPAAVCATLGTTSTTACDPIQTIGEICREFGIWFHVDAAYAGSAALLPELQHLFDGLEHADSYVFNPHKWMLTNFDCTAYFVANPDDLRAACAITPEYLKTRWDADVPNFRDWQIQLGRRFRALKLWFVLRAYGLEGIREMLRNHIQIADELRHEIHQHPDFKLVHPAPFGLVCLRAEPTDIPPENFNLLNAELLQKTNATGHGYATHTVLDGQYTLRISIGQWRTEKHHVMTFWHAMTDELNKLRNQTT